MVLKQVILVRQDLQLPKGKLASQAAHASVDTVLQSSEAIVKKWRKEGMAKIVVKVKDEKELRIFIEDAKAVGLVTTIISDAGRTTVEPGTVTCGAIGPAEEKDIDRITGELKLL